MENVERDSYLKGMKKFSIGLAMAMASPVEVEGIFTLSSSPNTLAPPPPSTVLYYGKKSRSRGGDKDANIREDLDREDDPLGGGVVRFHRQ